MSRASDVSEALATLQARWGSAAPRSGGELGLAVRPGDRQLVAYETDGALARAVQPLPLEAPEAEDPLPGPIGLPSPSPRAPAPSRPGRPATLADGRVVPTGFAALDAILGSGGLPRVRDRRAAWGRELGQDDARPAAGRGGAGRGLDRRVAGPRPRLRSRRGREPRRAPRVARRAHARGPRGGARDGGLAPGGTDRGPAGRGPARRAGSGGRAGAGGGPARPACRAGPAGGHAARAARAGDARAVARGRGGGGERAPAGAPPRGLDPARPGCRRPPERDHGRPQPLRPAGPPGGPRDPLLGRRRARRVPPPGRAPRRARRGRHRKRRCCGTRATRAAGRERAGHRGRGTVPGRAGSRATTVDHPPERPPRID